MCGGRDDIRYSWSRNDFIIMSEKLLNNLLGWLKKPDDLNGRKVLVVGLGTKGGGSEAVKWLVKHGAKVTVTDLKSEEELKPSLKELEGLPVTYVLGQHQEEDLENTELIIRNPAVPAESEYLAQAKEKGIPVIMDTTLFFMFCPAPIAGVTGTRGKTTTTMVAGQILRRSHKDTVIGFEVQRSPLAQLDQVKFDTPVVLELSSWRLEGVELIKKSPHYSVLTRILRDHLNRYDSFEAYVASKEPIMKHQTADDTAILPIDDPYGKRFAQLTKAQKKYFGVLEKEESGLSGIFRIKDSVILYKEGQEITRIPWSELGGVGDHTKRNMIAGALLAYEMGAAINDILSELREFKGVPNRLETVAEAEERTFVNDTTATTPDAVIAALRSFPGKNIVLITGGTDKKLEYEDLAEEMVNHSNLRGVVFLSGSGTNKLLTGIKELGSKELGEQVRSMAEAVKKAWEISEPGDVIVMSPGGSSFELFKDEFDRGEQFKRAVSEF